MKTLFVTLSLLFLLNAHSQSYLLKNEKIVFSFETKSGKTLMIARDSNDSYLTYRFGTTDSIEFVFPKSKKNSWKQFTYSYYYRSGGADNAELEQNYLYFNHNDFRYVVYWYYSAEGDQTECGIKMINQNTKAVKVIIGKAGTIQGSLDASFRENELVIEGEELFD